MGVLTSLLRIATSCAALCLRDEVLECPDAVVAVVLMEQTIAAKVIESLNSYVHSRGEISQDNSSIGR